MKKRLKKVTAILLIFTLIVSVVISGTLTPTAAKVETATGTNISVMPVYNDDYPSYYSNPAQDSLIDEWGFYNRECTSFCAWRLNSQNGVAFNNWYNGVNWGNASNWGYAAQNVGILVDNNPKVGSIAWSNGGHVAWVNAVNGNGTIIIEEYNCTWPGVQDESGRYLSRVVTNDHFTGYIHINDIIPIPPVSNPWTKASYSVLPTGWSNTFTFGAENAKDVFTIGINRDGTRILTENVTSGYTYTFVAPGNYTAYVTAYGLDGSYADSNVVSFTVFDAKNLGKSFVTSIININSGMAVGVNTGTNNVEIQKYTGSDTQLWKFERKSLVTYRYMSYRITNMATGRCLDVYDGATADGTNIWTFPSNDTEAQTWYIRENGYGGFSLVPHNAFNSCIDLYNGNTTEGNNIQLFTYGFGKLNQTFSLKYQAAPDVTKTFNGKRYELYNTAMPWKQAYKFCEQQGGHLVTINSEEEQNFICELIPDVTNNLIWAGATDLYSEGNWKWITGERMNYTNWSENQPDDCDNNEDYLMINKNTYKWNDANDLYGFTTNATTASFICEYENEVDIKKFTIEKSFDHNGHRYEVYSDRVDWQTAKSFCEEKGGNLLVIESSEENGVVFNQIQGLTNQYYWLGLTDVDIEGIWQWVTGTNFDYKNWSENQPDNDLVIEDYAELIANTGKWNDIKGFSPNYRNVGFICEYDFIKPDTYLGDVNLDGKLDIRDVTAIQRHISEFELFTKEELSVADTNGDNAVDINDATLLQMYLAEYDVQIG